MKKPVSFFVSLSIQRKRFLMLLILVSGIVKSNAQFSVAGANPFPTISFASRMVFFDADGDGDVDVLYQSSNASGVGWNYMQNNGNGTYTTIAASGTGTFTSGPFNGITFTQFASMFPIDFNNDGWMDLLDQQNNSGRLLIRGGSTFNVSGTNPFPILPFASRMSFFDADGDGDIDVLYQSSNTSGVGWNYMQNNGNSTYTTIAASGTGTFSSGPFNGITFTQFASMYTIDVDNDGDVDLLDQQNNASRLLIRSGSSFVISGSNPFPTLPFAARMGFGDADSDGDPDVLYQSSNTSGAGWNYMQNNGNGTYTTIAANGTGTFSSGPFNGITFTQFASLFVFDYDKDGDLDFLDQQNNASRLLIQTNTPPKLNSSTPALGSVGIYRDANIQLSFSEAVVAGSGNIVIRRLSDNAVFETIAAGSSNVTGQGTSTITINPTGVLAANTTYYVNFDKTAFRDANGAAFGMLPPGALAIMPITSSSFLSFNTSGVLPVRLISFTAKPTANGVVIEWKTASESAMDHFEIQVSDDALHFTALVTEPATNQLNHTYNYLDASLQTHSRYYRLATVELSGAITYSQVVKVDFGESKDLKLIITGSGTQLAAYFPQGQYTRAELFSNSGQKLFESRLGITDSRLTLNLSSYSAGLFYLRLSGTQQPTVRSFIK